MSAKRQLTSSSRREATRCSRVPRLALLAALGLTGAAGAAAGVLASRSSNPPRMEPIGSSAMIVGEPTAGGNSPPPASDASAGGSDLAAFYAGRALARNGEETVSLARAEQLADRVPAGAEVNTTTKTVRFTTRQVSFVVVASPPGADMQFRVAGGSDPTIDVPPRERTTWPAMITSSVVGGLLLGLGA
jgi:hypothetical protein